MKNRSNTKESKASGRLFLFTEQEERAMKRAMKKARDYMLYKYGRGRAPRMIDYDYYDN